MWFPTPGGCDDFFVPAIANRWVLIVTRFLAFPTCSEMPRNVSQKTVGAVCRCVRLLLSIQTGGFRSGTLIPYFRVLRCVDDFGLQCVT